MKCKRLLPLILLLNVWVAGVAQAACSAWMDKAFLNEYYFGTSGNQYLEIYSQDPSFSSGVWSSWTIDVYSGQNNLVTYSKNNTTQTTCTTGSKTWGALAGNLSLEAGHALVVVRDSNGDPVDVMAFDNGNPPNSWKSSSDNYLPALATQCSTLASRLNTQAAASTKPYSAGNMVVLPSFGNKDIGRFPDGSGLWSESGLTGSGTTKTQCASNSPFLTKTAASTTVAPGGVVNWTVGLVNSGNANQTNLVVTDTITSSAGAPALTGVTATPSSGCGTVSGFGTAGGSWTTSVAVGASCSLSISGTVPASALSSQSYTNTVAATLSFGSNSYPQSDTATVTVAAPSIDHYEIDVPNVGLTCQSGTINVRACASATTPCSASLASTASTTTLSASSGSFTNAGAATQTFTGSTAYTLAATSPATVTVGMTSPATTPVCYSFDGSTRTLLGSCAYAVKTAIFQFDVPNFQAGNGSGAVTISALRQDDASKKCVSFVPSGSVKLWTSYSDPGSGTKQASLTYGATTYTLLTSKPGAGNVPLAFDANGQTSVALDYLDVGLLRLDAEWNSITGNASFVVKPYFALSGITCADGTSNPAATNASGGKFCRAGQNFSATIKAVAKDGTTSTPNFGKEATPEGAKLASALVAPAGGAAPSLSGSVGGFSDVSGSRQASATYSWPEVGIISLTPGIADGDYLGAGDAAGTAVGNVGRFYPDHFDIDVTTQCAGFAYAGQAGTPAVTGQPFTVKATAKNAGGTVTSNYSYNAGSGFAKALNLTLPAGGTVGKLYVDAVQGGSGAIPASKFLVGTGQVNYSDLAGKISYVFDSFPWVETAIAVHGDDADSGTGSPVLAGGNGSATERAGRLWLNNAYGSELLSLLVPVRTQYWGASGWTTNTADSCTALTVPTNANTGLTNALKTKTTATLGGPPVASGVARLNLSAPGSGNAGLVDISGTILRGVNGWLTLSAPSARACFGSCGPRSPVIYFREQY